MTMAEQVEVMRKVAKDYGVAIDKCAESLRRWGERIHAEAMWRKLERSMASWSIEDRQAFQRRVRELHAAEPDESLTDCMLRVGAAMEICWRCEGNRAIQVALNPCPTCLNTGWITRRLTNERRNRGRRQTRRFR